MTTRRPKSQAITAKRVRELLEAFNPSKDDELSSELSSTVYELSDGRVLLVFEDGKGRVYESKETLISFIEGVAQQNPVHLLAGRLPQGKNFVNEVPALIDELATKLNIPVVELDRSESSLDKLDAALRRIGPTKFLQAEIFAPLVAYIGEVIRQAVGGRWESRLAEDGETWEPWIVDPQGHHYAPFASVFKEIQERGRFASIRGVVGGQIRSRLLGG